MTTIPVQFVWSVCKPDERQYEQNSMEFMPFVGNPPTQPIIEIDLPIELLKNHDEYLAKSKDPILSIAAVQYIREQWRKCGFSDPEVAPEDFKPTTEDDNWGDPIRSSLSSPTEDDSKKASEQLDSNWEETEKPETTLDPVWDEKQEDWGTEPNFDNQT